MKLKFGSSSSKKETTTTTSAAAVVDSEDVGGTKEINSAASSSSTCSNESKFPSDWPGPGPIDLNVHDLPHFSSCIEWWYLNAHLDVVVQGGGADKKKKDKKNNKTKKGNKKPQGKAKQEDDDDEPHPGVSLFASFFRMVTGHDKETNEYVFGHSVLWALMDHKSEKYYNVSLVDPRLPEVWLKQLQEDKSGADERLKKATMELLEKGSVPYPDRLLKNEPTILGRNMTRLPDKEEGMSAVLKEEHNKEAKSTSKKSGGGCCCFRGSAKNVLDSVTSGGMPRLSLNYDDNSFVRNRDGSYDLILEDNDVHDVKVKLHFVPHTEAIRNGGDGVIDGEDTIPDFFYYTLPHCTVTGTVTLPDKEKDDNYNAKIQRKKFFVIGDEEEEDEDDDDNDEAVETVNTCTYKVNGKGWYDHQFGSTGKSASSKEEDDKVNFNHDPSYTWLGLQLDNGYQLSCSELFIRHGLDDAAAQQKAEQEEEKPKYYAILIDPKGKCQQLDPSDFTFTESDDKEKWVSMKTFREYPVKWEFSVPSMGIKIELEATTPQQEFVTIISKPAFWEGCVKASGTFGGDGGAPVTGKGFVERKGFCHPSTLTMEYFFKCVSKETLKSVQKFLPFNPEGDKFNQLVSHKDNAHYTEFIDSHEFSKALVEPIRAVLDRGGKSWRSYAALACCDMVGGNSQHVRDWLALPELMHVGSLIVDDVEDRSTIRRGGPCSHVMYGEDVAINAGTMAYFIGQICVYEGDGDAQQKVDIYNLYFEAMRAAHSGQAMDIHGLEYMMPEVVENGGDLCCQRVIAIHRLKSAVPASSLAGMGCRLGGGSKKQSKGLADYYEALGIAFQIVDDVLNLRGFHDGLKTKGEDITAGKVTYPVAKAMSRLDKADRARLWELVSSKPEDIETIGKAISLIEKVNAIEDSYKEAKDMMEDAWRKLDPLVVDSMVKVNLRAFSHYVLDRTY